MTMTLAEWRQAEREAGRRWTLERIAQKVGIASPESVRRHLDGSRQPRADTMRAYRKLTGGKVDIADWFPDKRKRRPNSH